jgi:protein-S-isoprenylcysteine O-methyltransferase Ste14
VTAENDHPHVVIFPPLMLVLCIVAGALATWLVPYRLHGTAWPWVGGAMALAAIALAVWGSRTMKAAGTNVRPDQPTTAIVAAGPFARSRNPLYVGLITLFIGIGLLLRSPAFLVFVIPLVLVLRYGVIAREEIYLEGKFGDTYRVYRAHVRRWI